MLAGTSAFTASESKFLDRSKLFKVLPHLVFVETMRNSYTLAISKMPSLQLINGCIIE